MGSKVDRDRITPGSDGEYSLTPQQRVIENLQNRPIPAQYQKTGADVSHWSAQKKLEAAIKLSVPMMSKDMQPQMQELLKPETLAALTGGLAILGLAHAYGVGEVVDGLLIAKFGVENTTKLLRFALGTVTAERESDLKLAARDFADVAKDVGVFVAAAGLLKGAATATRAVTEQLPKLAQLDPKTAVILSGSAAVAKIALNKLTREIGDSVVKQANSIGPQAVKTIQQLINGTKNAQSPKQTIKEVTATELAAVERVKLVGTYGVKAEVIASLGNKGISPKQLEAYLESFPKAKYPNPKAMGQVATTLNNLAEFSATKRVTQGTMDALLNAAQEPQGLATVKRAIELAKELKNTGRITNPEAIGKVLDEGIKGINGQIKLARAVPVEPYHPMFSNGKIYELEVALREIKANPKLNLQLGYREMWDSVYVPNKYSAVRKVFARIGGDIIDNQSKTVTQVKQVIGTKIEHFTKNIYNAIEQLNGQKKIPEVVPPGYRTNIDIKLPNNSEVGKLNLNEVIQKIKNKQLENFDGTIRIEFNGRVLKLEAHIDKTKGNSNIKVIENKGWPQQSSSIQGESNLSLTADNKQIVESKQTRGSGSTLQPTPSRGETPEVAAINDAKLQEILARMQARQQAGNNQENSIDSNKYIAFTGTVNSTTDTALTGSAVAPQSSPTALTGGDSTTALTGGTSTTALTGGSNQQPQPTQQSGLALSQ